MAAACAMTEIEGEAALKIGAHANPRGPPAPRLRN